MQFLASLNADQKRAVQTAPGPVLIIAGPGTGKTKTLTARIAYLLTSKTLSAEHIVALTFTRKAAEEMRQRVSLLLQAEKQSGNMPHITTFHGLCHELLGGTLQFVTEPERIQIIKNLPRPAALKGLSARELGLRISRAKNLADDDPALQRLVIAYNAALHERTLLDFDDLLVQTRSLLEQDATTRQEVQQRFKAILVDEFQDTNRLQYELLQLLRGHDNLFVIGDPNQSIYGFRGASGSIFQQFKADFPNHTAITLTTNYRSTPEVVQVANAVFRNAVPLQAQHTLPGRVRVVEVLNEYSEAHWVLNEIQKAIGGGDMLRAVSDDDRARQRTLKDFAILYRSRAAAIALQKTIDESGLPYQIVGDGSPYEHPKVQAIIALLRAAVQGDVAVLEGFTAAETRLLQDVLAQTDLTAPSALAGKLIAILGFENAPAVQQLVNTLVRFKTLPAVLAYFDTIAETQFYDPAADAVTLLTIHAAKGLEFPYVFLVAAEEGMLPHERSELDEEKRLFYVAVTRAKECLEITHARHRGGQPATISRFITDLPVGTIERMVDPDIAEQARRIAKKVAKRSQQSLF